QQADLKKKGFKAEVYEEDLINTQLWLAQLQQQPLKAETVPVEGNVLSVAFAPKQQQLLLRVAPTALIDDNYMASQYQLVDFSGKVQQRFATVGKLDKAELSPDGSKLALIGSEDIH